MFRHIQSTLLRCVLCSPVVAYSFFVQTLKEGIQVERRRWPEQTSYLHQHCCKSFLQHQATQDATGQNQKQPKTGVKPGVEYQGQLAQLWSKWGGCGEYLPGGQKFKVRITVDWMLASMRDNEAGVMVIDTICLLGDIEPRVGRVDWFGKAK